MKPLHLLQIGLIALGMWLPSRSVAQFTTMDNQPVEVCDCRTKVNSLNVTLEIPKSVKNYDIIGFQLIQDGQTLGTNSYYTSSLDTSKAMTFNILNPDGVGGRNFFGQESNLYQGDNFRFGNYTTICNRRQASKLYLLVYGMKQTGTQTTYSVNPNGEIIGKTDKLYGNALVLYTTSELPVIPLGIRPKSGAASVASTGFTALGVGAWFLLKSTFAKMGF